MKNSEAKTGFPKLNFLDGGVFAVGGGDIILKGSGLTAGETTLDSYQLVEAAVELTVSALKPGNTGFVVEVVVGGGGLVLAWVDDYRLLITLAAGGSTADAVATAINADGSVVEGILRANVDAAGNFTVGIDEAPLAGGTGELPFAVYAGGAECLPANETGTTSTAKWADGSITVTVPDLTGESPAMAANDLVQVKVVANGIESDSLTVVVTA
jgi:hypothetical protein